MVAMGNWGKKIIVWAVIFPSFLFVGEEGSGFGVPRLATCSWCTLHSLLFDKRQVD
jgi:hypothetical protein